MEQVIYLIIVILVFCIAAYALNWVCQTFFPTLAPVRWICGAVLLILILLFIANQIGGVGTPFLQLRR